MVSEWYKKFSSQPHQPFFAAGFTLFIFFITLLLLLYTGTMPIDSSVFKLHAYPMIFLVFIQFFLGFLFVVFPRFLMQALIQPAVYMRHFYLFASGSVLYIAGLLFFEPLLPIAALTILAAQINSFALLLSIYRKSIVKDKYDTRWILIAFGCGIAANIVAVIYLIAPDYPILQKSAVNIGFYLFLFLLIFTVSQRMIPHFTEVKVEGYRVKKSRNLMEILFALLLLKLSFTLSGAVEYEFAADIPLLIFFVREFLLWKLPVSKVPPIIWVLYLSLAWIPAAFAISAAESLTIFFDGTVLFEKAALHAIAVGYFLTVLIGFATRVVLGHSGRVPTADRTAVAIFFFAQVAALSRVAAAFSLNFGGYTTMIAVSAALTLALLLAWCLKYFRILAITF
ncbi:NnrS protein [Hydrogenimonas sp.]|nr:NnrS protein [Hydrogenimonas sp.]